MDTDILEALATGEGKGPSLVGLARGSPRQKQRELKAGQPVDDVLRLIKGPRRCTQSHKCQTLTRSPRASMTWRQTSHRWRGHGSRTGKRRDT
jgi:hypothetical protein